MIAHKGVCDHSQVCCIDFSLAFVCFTPQEEYPVGPRVTFIGNGAETADRKERVSGLRCGAFFFRHANWSALDEGQQVLVEAILMGEEQAVRCVLIHLELTPRDRLGSSTSAYQGSVLVILPVNDQRRHSK